MSSDLRNRVMNYYAYYFIFYKTLPPDIIWRIKVMQNKVVFLLFCLHVLFMRVLEHKVNFILKTLQSTHSKITRGCLQLP